MNIIGIDPGMKGAIVVLNDRGEIVEKCVMPLVGGVELDAREFKNILVTNKPCHVYLEDVHAIFGSAAGATFSFGKICGSIETAIALCDVPYTKVQPKAWQKVIYQGIPEIRKPSKKATKGRIDTKAMSEVAAKRLFPDEDFRASERCRISHDGIIDALCIAEYGRRMMGGK
jgi:crossover junction endodeoxyribonuclease RuvC